jgi:hypothetical protein
MLKEIFLEGESMKKLFIIKSTNPKNSKIEYMVFCFDDSYYRYWTEDIECATIFSQETIDSLQNNKYYDSRDFMSMKAERGNLIKVYLEFKGESLL